MGYSTTQIPFFDDRIEIDAHTASFVEHLRQISIEDFCEDQRASLEIVEETGEYIVRRADGAFIHGPEVYPEV